MARVTAVSFRNAAREAMLSAGGRGFVRFMDSGTLLVSDAVRRCEDNAAKQKLVDALYKAGFACCEQDGLLMIDPQDELLETIMPERIEKIESEKSLPHPDEVLTMAEKYKRPSICNYYCSRQCPIGQQYVPEIEIKELSSIVLEMLASLNSVNKKKDRLIEITADGKIDNDEIDDFIYIQEELERISITVETLQLWAERMIANGVIDAEVYNERKNK